ncbi:MAG: hypothetical protein ACUVQY_08400 [Thermoproteota archaeon]
MPSPRQVSPLNLRRLALTTLEMLNTNYSLSDIVFKPENDPAWGELQIALSACLPPNIIYNLTVYEVQSGNAPEGLYRFVKSISNAERLGVGSDTASYLVASSNVTFKVTPEKIGERGVGGTLYILNCSDANGWWVTGYTTHSLAQDLYNLLSQYFNTTVMVQNTAQLGQILNNQSLQGEVVQNAVIINTCGEAVPIPSAYCTSPYSDGNYASYCHFLGNMTRLYNWTWVSIVGYPLYYVSNVNAFPNNENTYGIYGMISVGSPGLNAFLRGLDNQNYAHDDSWLTTSLSEPVYLSSEARYYCNYYGIYPSPYQTSTRALPDSILTTYHLPSSSVTYIFNKVGSYIPGAVYRHVAAGDNKITGSLFALGLTRTPDIRLTVLGLLCAFKPRLYRSEYTATNTTKLVVLQLGQAGGI